MSIRNLNTIWQLPNKVRLALPIISLNAIKTKISDTQWRKSISRCLHYNLEKYMAINQVGLIL